MISMSTRRLAGLLAGFALTLAGGRAELQQKAPRPQERISRPAPEKAQPQVEPPRIEGGPIVSESGSSLLVIGDATASMEQQARANSWENAVYRTATEVNRRIFAIQGAQLSIGFDDLRAYVRRVVREAGTQQVAVQGRVRVYTRFEMNKAFVDPGRIAALAQPSRPSGSDAVGYLLLPGSRDGNPGGFVRRVQVRTAAARNGNFYFTFAFRQTPHEELAVRLTQIEVDQDGSPGRATWRFDVALNKRQVISVEPASYDDDVGRYPQAATAPGLQFTVGADEQNVEIRVTGVRWR
jgi:hypothetical protein